MSEIKEAYVSFDTAKLLKEKGFDIATNFVYSIACRPDLVNKPSIDFFYSTIETQYNRPYSNIETIPKYISGEIYSCPTQQMAMRWLREVNKIYIWIKPLEGGNCFVSHVLYNEIDKCVKGGAFGTYEEAVEAALKYSLKNLI